MKGKLFFFAMLSFTLGCTLLQTPWAKEKIKHRIELALAAHGTEVSIGHLEGTMPLSFTLCEVKGPQLHLSELKLRVAILPLLKGKVQFSYLRAKGQVKDLPFIARGRAHFKKTALHLDHLIVGGDGWQLRGQGTLLPKLKLYSDFAFSDLAVYSPIQGSGIGSLLCTNDTLSLNFDASELVAGNIPIPSASFSIAAQKQATSWKGEFSACGDPLKASIAFEFDPSTQFIELPTINIEGPDSHLSGKLSTLSSFDLFEGELDLFVGDLNHYSPAFDEPQLRGSLSANAHLQSKASMQQLSLTVEGSHLRYKETSCENLSMHATLQDLLGALKGTLQIDGKSLTFPQLTLDGASLKTAIGKGRSPFTLFAWGNFKDPLEITAEGTWEKKLDGMRAQVQKLEGYTLKKTFHLRQPFKVIWGKERFKICHFDLNLAKGNLFARVDLTPSSSLIKIQGQEFPIDFVGLIRPEFSFDGTSDFHANILSWEKMLEGNLNLTLKRAHLNSAGLKSKGSVQVHLNKNIAQIHGDLKATGGQSLNLSASLPFDYDHFPFSFRLNRTKPFTAQVTSEGRLEDLFDFINIGAHRIEGWLTTHLLFSQTLEKPSLRGRLEWQDGLYVNHYTGTTLKNIQAKAQANKQTIAITSLTAEDASGDGNVACTGNILVDPTRNFPFTIDADLTELQTVSFDTITGRFGGKLQISGDTESATARGDLTVAKAHFHIPDTLPADIPELPITFINVPEVLQRGQIATPKLYPFYLNLNVKAPKNAFVQGKGLSCELKGNLHLTGTYTDIAANGSLHLVMGEYLFSGKLFSLTEGEIIFRNSPHPSAYLSIVGTCDLPEVTATAILRGPISSPHLSFQSSPQLPISSLLSQILFNKDLAEVSAIQAIQIAQTILTLSSGNAPDVLEKVRTALGIDRLTVATSENDPSKISLQIGKYVIPGVMLSWTQGSASHNLSVEVDLKKGFFAQAEVDELQQGKFSLRWHHHY